MGEVKNAVTEIPANVVGIRLCKMVGDDLRLGEPVLFQKGHPAVVTLFRRAAISGVVGPVGETGDFWADLLSDADTWVETLALDRDAWNSIKNHWARCRMDNTGAARGRPSPWSCPAVPCRRGFDSPGSAQIEGDEYEHPRRP
jgi:hypothetical protein